MDFAARQPYSIIHAARDKKLVPTPALDTTAHRLWLGQGVFAKTETSKKRTYIDSSDTVTNFTLHNAYLFLEYKVSSIALLNLRKIQLQSEL